MDTLTKDKRSELMAKIKGKGTKMERIVRLTLKGKGIKFKANPTIYGHPDIIIPKSRIAVFLDGCFWHGCKKDKTIPKSNTTYWESKIITNKRRDRLVSKTLRKRGWMVVRVWEHQIKNDPNIVLRKLRKAYN